MNRALALLAAVLLCPGTLAAEAPKAPAAEAPKAPAAEAPKAPAAEVYVSNVAPHSLSRVPRLACQAVSYVGQHGLTSNPWHPGGAALNTAAEPAEIQVGAGDGFSWSAATSTGWGGDIHRMERFLAESGQAMLLIDAESNLDAVGRLIRSFTAVHGPWVKIVLERRDPAEKFHEYQATLGLPKAEFSTDEPIPLALRILPGQPPKNEGDFVPEAPWWLFSPTHLKVEDDRGREVNLFTRPVSKGSGGVRSKVFYGLKEKTLDLTSFVVPYHGIEFVGRWEPGVYRVTYYFFSNMDDASEPAAFMRPHVFGSRSSNTATFTVRKTEEAKPPDTAAMMAAAAALVKKNRANDAVEAYKRVVLAARDPATIQQAVRQILLIRTCVSFDEEEMTLKRGQRLADLMSKDVSEDWIRGGSLELLLLNLAPADRRAWVDRYLKINRRMEGMDVPGMSEADQQKEEAFWSGARLEWLFLFPQLRPMLDEALQHPDACPPYYIDVYLTEVEPKDPAIMRAFLTRDPVQVLLYYRQHKAPLELVPFIRRHFDDEGIPDLPMEAFEKAIGLNLGLQDEGASPPRRGASHDAVRTLLDAWWQRHAVGYGVTAGADDALIWKRLSAIRASDEVWLGAVERIERKDGQTLIKFNRRCTFHGDYRVVNPEIIVPAGMEVPALLLKKEGRVVVCVSRADRPDDFLLKCPDGVWPAETQE